MTGGTTSSRWTSPQASRRAHFVRKRPGNPPPLMAGGQLTPPLMVSGGLGVDADLPPVYDLGEIVGGSPPLRVLGPKIAQVPPLPMFIDGRPAARQTPFQPV